MFFTQEILLYILKQYQYLINISLYDDKSLRYYDNENFILEIPKLIATSFGNNEYIFTINENQLVYFEALYNNFKTMKTEDLSCKITKETIKEFIVPKIFSFYPFSNFSLINLVNLVDKKGIYKDYQYMIQIEEH